MDYYHFSCFFSLCFHHRLCMSLVQNTGGQRDWENKLLFRLDGMHKTITIEILIIICFLAMKKKFNFSPLIVIAVDLPSVNLLDITYITYMHLHFI